MFEILSMIGQTISISMMIYGAYLALDYLLFPEYKVTTEYMEDLPLQPRQ